VCDPTGVTTVNLVVLGQTIGASDVNKDWRCKDKDQAYKDQDKDKD